MPLGGIGVGDGNFLAGEIYTVEKFTPAILSANFSSDGNDDGWVLKSKESIMGHIKTRRLLRSLGR